MWKHPTVTIRYREYHRIRYPNDTSHALYSHVALLRSSKKSFQTTRDTVDSWYSGVSIIFSSFSSVSHSILLPSYLELFLHGFWVPYVGWFCCSDTLVSASSRCFRHALNLWLCFISSKRISSQWMTLLCCFSAALKSKSSIWSSKIRIIAACFASSR